METAFKSWIISLLIAGVASALLKILIHGGKSEKTVEKCVGIVLSLIIIAPLPVIFGKAKNIESSFEYVYSEDAGYENYAEDYILGLITKKIENNLREEGFPSSSVSIDGTYKNANIEINYVIVKLNAGVIDDENEHIHNVEKAVAAVNLAIKIEKDRIIVYD